MGSSATPETTTKTEGNNYNKWQRVALILDTAKRNTPDNQTLNNNQSRPVCSLKSRCQGRPSSTEVRQKVTVINMPLFATQYYIIANSTRQNN